MLQELIDRTLVHKDSSAAVLLTSAVREEPGHWFFGVSLPRDHSTSSQSSSGIATILGTELMRQTALAFAHLDGGVPLGSSFLLHEISFSWNHDPALLPGHPMLEAVLEVHAHQAKMRKGLLSDLQLWGSLTSDGVLLGTGYGDLSCLSPALYKAIRRNAPPVEPVNTGAVGTVLDGVRNNGSSLEAALVWNWQDPFLFDHFSDHLPGMLLGQAVVDAHRILTGTEALQLHLRCGTFGEFNAPATVAAEITTGNHTRTTITQPGRSLATGLCSSGFTKGIRDIGPPQFQRQLS
ncbi:hypothetical protein IV500_12135 [Paeniglutamicibacter antarcticus]|uniref:A-factor biosynthesis hotdog domain-containing protein n=1 Tax=Arthrobacter terrae TaxID=2935737 RepID=A0A931G8D4_9MICC|nr:AfsA-related hotdog domain-containing protein [Arthrobacter terrae]MBG0740129.1 hypothetical protein [Arthrobacter terrae]